MEHRQAGTKTPESGFADALFVNRPEKVFGTGLKEVGQHAWLYYWLDKPIGIAGDVPVNELTVRAPTGELVNTIEKLSRIER